jgi:glutamyl-tRNA synthetase
VIVQNTELDDLIIARSDNTPTYNLTVVVDDWDMEITHVIRGDDHLNNTPRQINILQALGAPIPQYAHVPMILGDDGQRLSKRHGAVSVMNYKDDGYLPEALLNYLVRLGWSHGDQEIFSIQEMMDLFELSDVNGKPSAFNTEKLVWLNQHYLKAAPRDTVATHLLYHLQKQGLEMAQGPSLMKLIEVQAERCKTLKELAETSHYFFTDLVEYDEKAVKKHFKAAIKPALATLGEKLAALSEWDKEGIHGAVDAVVEQYELKFGKIAQPLRVAITGSSMSPSIDVTAELIGQKRVIKRIEQALTLFPQ